MEHKLPSETVVKIQEVLSETQQSLYSLGETELALNTYRKQKQALYKRLKDLENREQEILDELNVKYKNGTIDLDRMVYIPDLETEESANAGS